MHADPESIVCKFGGDPAICLREEAICAKVYRRTDAAQYCISSFLEWAKNVCKRDKKNVTPFLLAFDVGPID